MNHPRNNQPTAKARREDLVVQEMPDEVLVYDLKSHKAHCLNETAAFVWTHCDGKTTASEMAVLMEKQWRKPVTEEVVWLALRQLSRTGLLEERVDAVEAGNRASRRAVLRRLGAAAAMTPLVISIVAPAALAGASFVPPVCQACRKKSDGACPPDCGQNVLGTCYSNSGCGNGQEIPPCMSCADCFGNPAFGTTISWKAPGTLGC